MREIKKRKAFIIGYAEAEILHFLDTPATPHSINTILINTTLSFLAIESAVHSLTRKKLIRSLDDGTLSLTTLGRRMLQILKENNFYDR